MTVHKRIAAAMMAVLFLTGLSFGKEIKALSEDPVSSAEEAVFQKKITEDVFFQDVPADETQEEQSAESQESEDGQAMNDSGTLLIHADESMIYVFETEETEASNSFTEAETDAEFFETEAGGFSEEDEDQIFEAELTEDETISENPSEEELADESVPENEDTEDEDIIEEIEGIGIYMPEEVTETLQEDLSTEYCADEASDGSFSEKETGTILPDQEASDEFLAEEENEEEESTILSASDSDLTAGNKADTGTEAVVSSIDITPVSTNDQYSQLTFSFTADGKEYTCLVTGIEEQGNNTEEAYQSLAQAIAESFLAGDVFTLSNETASEYDLTLDLIDAEKINRYSGEDHNICWAASAADMLEYAGWNQAEDEDEAFQEFREEFSDLGGYQAAGISWYLDGINPEQYTYKQSGRIAYHQDLDYGASQQQNEGSGGYWKEYAAAQVVQDNTEQPEEQLEDALEKLEDGYAVGLGVYFYQDQNTLSAGHALTVFGYIREKLEQAASAIRALFISDSDDRATSEKSAPEDRPNEYVMYSTAPFENDSLSTLQLDNYNQSSLTAAIGRVTTLAPQKTAEREQDGTGDATASPNLTLAAISIQDQEGISTDQAEAGSTVTVESEFKNLSYQALPKGAKIRYQVNIYRDGELADQAEQTLSVDSEKGMRANSSATGSLQVTLDQGGEYTFETQILEIMTAEGESITEAYVKDNLYRGASVRLNVPADENPEPEEPEEAETVPGGSTDATEEPDIETEKIYTLTVVLATDTEYLLDFEASAASPESFTRLRNRKTGVTADPESYRIVRKEDGGFTISFEEAFIRSLRPGWNDFALTWKNGRVLIRIIIL